MFEDSVDESSRERSPHTTDTPAQTRRWQCAGSAILVVDDDPLVRACLAAALARWGHSVDVAVQGVDALRCLSRRAYAAIITDLQMPLMDGVSLWQTASGAGHPGAWILMTGSPGPWLQCGLPILHKPFRLPELRAALERAIHCAAGGP